MPKLKIATLGEGSNAARATKEWVEKRDIKGDIVYCESISEIFEKVTSKKVRYGVVPIEDSVVGSVNETFECLRRYLLDGPPTKENIQIVGEMFLDVYHSLLAKKTRNELKAIASHPQALDHCRNILKTEYPDLKTIKTSSTSEAARLAAQDPTIGAIAHKSTAQIYGLNILREDTMHDYGKNMTRFIAVGLERAPPTESDKTSISVVMKDHPGALYEILGEFASRDINLTKIESRPYTRQTIGDYLFYIDFVGSIQEPAVVNALNGIKKRASLLKNIGSYPQGEHSISDSIDIQDVVRVEPLGNIFASKPIRTMPKDASMPHDSIIYR